MQFQSRFCAGLAAFAAVSAAIAPAPALAQAEPFIGQVSVFGFSFCPRGWAEANGQLMPIAQNQALFSLLGTFYGGDGRTTFALPDLRGRVVIGKGQGPGLSGYNIGARGGLETSTLSAAQMPAHAHGLGTTAPGTTVTVKPATGGQNLADVPASGGASTAMTDTAGGGQAHDNRQPWLAMTICVAVQGIFPSRS